MKQMVVGFMFLQQEPTINAAPQVVLIKKDHPAWQAGKYNGVGGTVRPNELAPDAMAREFLEETGVITLPADWSLFLTMTNVGMQESVNDPMRDDQWCVHCFACDHPDAQKVAAQPLETEVPRCVPVAYALQMLSLMPNLHWVLALAMQRDKYEPLLVVAPDAVNA